MIWNVGGGYGLLIVLVVLLVPILIAFQFDLLRRLERRNEGRAGPPFTATLTIVGLEAALLLLAAVAA